MRAILFGLIAVLLGCLGITVPTDHTSTVSGTYGLKAIGFSGTAAPCYTSTMADPTLVPPDVNTAFLSIGTLTLDADGTGVFNAHYEVRHGMDLKISWKGVAGNGQIFPGDATLWTKQPWCAGLSSQGTTQRFDFNRQ
jgi:hypothetical protein